MDDATTAAADSLQELAAELRAFARARNWEHYHTPNNLTMALARPGNYWPASSG